MDNHFVNVTVVSHCIDIEQLFVVFEMHCFHNQYKITLDYEINAIARMCWTILLK